MREADAEKRQLEIRRRVDLCGRVVAFQCALERRAAALRAGLLLVGLLGRAVAGTESTLGLLLVPLATPNPPGNDTNDSQNNGTTNATNDTNDGLLLVLAHARLLLLIVSVATATGQPWRGRRSPLASECREAPIIGYDNCRRPRRRNRSPRGRCGLWALIRRGRRCLRRCRSGRRRGWGRIVVVIIVGSRRRGRRRRCGCGLRSSTWRVWRRRRRSPGA